MNNLAAVETGFRHDEIVSAQFNLPQRYDRDKRMLFLDQALERLRAIPGVSNASFTYSIPLAGSNWNSIFIIEGQPVPERSKLAELRVDADHERVLRHDGHPPVEGPRVRQPRRQQFADGDRRQ